MKYSYLLSIHSLLHFSSAFPVLQRVLHQVPRFTTHSHPNFARFNANELTSLSSGKEGEAITDDSQKFSLDPTIWESLASSLFDPSESYTRYAGTVSILRVGIPSLLLAFVAQTTYPTLATLLAEGIDDSGVFAVVAQDASQYIQNICTTSGLLFSLLVGQTYYFMYQQQEATYMALYEEVTWAKALLEQAALVASGRPALYERLLTSMEEYVREDLLRGFNDRTPAVTLADGTDTLEEVLYLTSVGEPSVIYDTVRALRQARAFRLGALQKKLPSLHMMLLWVLGLIVLLTFPLLGAGVQTIGGLEILQVQSYYLGLIVLGMSMTLGVINELQRPGETGAYNARGVLSVMIQGLQEELQQRLQGQNVAPSTLAR